MSIIYSIICCYNNYQIFETMVKPCIDQIRYQKERKKS